MFSASGCDADPGSSGFIAFLVIMAVSVVVFTIGALVAQAKGRSALRTAVAALPGFKPSRGNGWWRRCDGIAVDEQSRKVCLSVSGPPPTTRIVGYKDLLEAEILENGKTVTKTARTSQVGRAVLGGLLLGPVGPTGRCPHRKDQVHGQGAKGRSQDRGHDTTGPSTSSTSFRATGIGRVQPTMALSPPPGSGTAFCWF